jgi:hypothetical protein
MTGALEIDHSQIQGFGQTLRFVTPIVHDSSINYSTIEVFDQSKASNNKVCLNHWPRQGEHGQE